MLQFQYQTRLESVVVRCAITMCIVGAFIAHCWCNRKIDGKDYLELSLIGRYAVYHGVPYKQEAVSFAYEEATQCKAASPIPGFIYPPAIIPTMLPTCLLPYEIGVRLWFILLTSSCIATVALVRKLSHTDNKTSIIVLAIMLACTVTQSAFLVGQAAMFIAFGVAVGVHESARKSWAIASIGWGLLAVKPQIGLAFLSVAYATAGWRAVLSAGIGMSMLTLIGASITGDPIHALTAYLPHAAATVYQIEYNRVTNDQIVSWNRGLYLISGVEINLTAIQIVAGVVVFLAVVAIRELWSGAGRMSVEYWLAAASIAGPAFGQAKGYDLVVLVLWMPYVLSSYRLRGNADLIVFLAAICAVSVPRSVVSVLSDNNQLVLSYRMWTVLLLAVWLLLKGPVLARKSATSVANPAPLLG